MLTHPEDKWNYHSAVTPCATCEGTGEVWNGKGNGGNDPDSFNVDCPNCGDPTPGVFACKVCGFQHVVPGYDCLACETVAAIPVADLHNLPTHHLTRAIEEALGAARYAHPLPMRRVA